MNKICASFNSIFSIVKHLQSDVNEQLLQGLIKSVERTIDFVTVLAIGFMGIPCKRSNPSPPLFHTESNFSVARRRFSRHR